MEDSQGVRREALTGGAAYVMLFVLGVAQGIIGCFEFSHSVGSFPLAALGFCAAILATCLLAAAGMGTTIGGLVPAVGWLAASFVLTLPTAWGSVIVTNTPAGKWYLYGGAVCAAVGVAASLRRRARVPSRPARTRAPQ